MCGTQNMVKSGCRRCGAKISLQIQHGEIPKLQKKTRSVKEPIEQEDVVTCQKLSNNWETNRRRRESSSSWREFAAETKQAGAQSECAMEAAAGKKTELEVQHDDARRAQLFAKLSAEHKTAERGVFRSDAEAVTKTQKPEQPSQKAKNPGAENKRQRTLCWSEVVNIPFRRAELKQPYCSVLRRTDTGGQRTFSTPGKHHQEALAACLSTDEPDCEPQPTSPPVAPCPKTCHVIKKNAGGRHPG